jgi:fido (protein-threonine AMPylation protein)
MMFLISEVHPFDDGNGRLARLAMNAELSNAGQHRILVPIISRNDYLNGLRRLPREQDPRLLCRVLATLWRWSAQVDYSDLALARVDMDRTNALVDPTDAERNGLHLILPADLLDQSTFEAWTSQESDSG